MRGSDVNRMPLIADAYAGLIIVFALAIIILGPPVWWIVSSYFEASAYNRQTGASATTWDAMWTELRVMGVPKP